MPSRPCNVCGIVGCGPNHTPPGTRLHKLELDFGNACVLVTVGEPGARATVVLTRDERAALIRRLQEHEQGQHRGELMTIVEY